MDDRHEQVSGLYRHYKGRFYLGLGIARHSETGERLAVYVPLYPHAGDPMAARPLEMFLGCVDGPMARPTSGLVPRRVRRFRPLAIPEGQPVEAWVPGMDHDWGPDGDRPFCCWCGAPQHGAQIEPVCNPIAGPYWATDKGGGK